MRRITTILTLAAAALGMAAQAYGYSITSGGNASLSSGTFSSVAGATIIDFEGGLPSNVNAGGLVVSYSGGALVRGNAAGLNAPPLNDLSQYWAVGPDHGGGAEGVMTFSQPLSYFGFDWSTPDSYNQVTLFRGSAPLLTFTGDTPANARYLNIIADNPGEFFDKVVFNSSSNAFETDNHAFKIGIVPEPSTYAMLVAGLLTVGAIARRRARM